MKKSLLALLITLFAFTACVAQTHKTTKVKDYIKSLEKKSEKNMHKEIERDTASLNSLISESEDFYLMMNFGMSFSSGDQEQNIDDFISEEPFSLNFDIEKERNYFNSFSQNALFHQSFSTEGAEFDILNQNILDRGDIRPSHKVNKIYLNGIEVDKKNIGLVAVDSLLVETEMIIPLSTETFNINKIDEEITTYKEYKIDIKKEDDKNIVLYVPVELYSKILNYQATTADGKLMNPTSNNTAPLFTISENLISKIKEMNEILVNCLSQSDKKIISSQLNQLIQEQFDARKTLTEYIESIKNADKKNIGFEGIEQLITDGIKKGILEIKKQRISATFPHPIASINLYIGTEFETLKKEIIVKDGKNKKSKYNVFEDTNYKKGLVDQNGNIKLKAKYLAIYDISDGYYNIVETEDWYNTPVWLNEKTNNFERLPKGFSHSSPISENIAVFSDSLKKLGIMEKTDKILLPFEYMKILKIGDYWIAEKETEREDSYDFFEEKSNKKIEIFDEKFNKIPIDIQKYKSLTYDVYDDIMDKNPESNLFIVRSADKYGLLNFSKPLTWLLPAEYDKIKTFYDVSDILYVEKNSDENNLCGIIDTLGNINIPVIYEGISYINYKNNDKHLFIAYKKIDGVTKYGIINIHNETIVPFDYNYITEVFDDKGLFIVTKKINGIDSFGLVNIFNKIITPLEYSYISQISNWPDNWLRTEKIVKGKELNGVIDTNGKTIISPEYESLNYNNDGFFKFYKNDKIGLINPTAKITIPSQFTDVSSFIEGFAFVVGNGFYGIIDTKGKYVMKKKYKGEPNYESTGYGTNIIYSIDGKNYNYKGE